MSGPISYEADSTQARSLNRRGSLAEMTAHRRTQMSRGNTAEIGSRPATQEIGSKVATRELAASGDQEPDPTLRPNALTARDIEMEKVAYRQFRLTQVPGTDTGINEKEEALEKIMCAEAETAFHQMNRFQLDSSFLTRCCVDPERVDGFDQDRAWEVLDGSDLQVVLPDSDDELEEDSPGGIEVYHLTPESDPSRLARGLKFGFHLEPAPAGKLDQDRMFVAHCGDYMLLGLVNSHGPQELGCRLADVIAEEMPYAVFRDPVFVSGDVAAGLASAFQRVHLKAIRRVDCRYTGAACTVLVLSEDKIWVAHVGDCKVVLGMPDDLPNAEDFHFHSAPLTMDHKLAVQAEFDRVVSHGGEVRRLLNDHVHRMFVEFEDLPGLLLTRSLGDRVGQTIGVLNVPTVAVLNRADLPEGSFLALGSGGLWTTMSDRAVANWVGNYFEDASVACGYLSREAIRRWEDPDATEKTRIHSGYPAGEHPLLATGDVNWDCFSVALLFPSTLEVAAPETEEPVHPRRFSMGPHQACYARRSWQEVKSVNRLMTLLRNEDDKEVMARMLKIDEECHHEE